MNTLNISKKMLLKLLAYAIPLSILICSCTTTSYFTTANDLQNKDCTLYLLNGQQQNGKLTIQFETGHDAKKTVTLKTPAKKIEIPVDSVKYYRVGPDTYWPKEIDLNAFEIPYVYNLYLPNVRNILFLKKLTKENARMDLFELYQSRNKTSDGQDHYEYYVSFPTEGRLMASNIRSAVFFPSFDEKMSKLVSDCPQLAAKIESKTKGYSLAQFSVDVQKINVFKRIVQEYNACK